MAFKEKNLTIGLTCTTIEPAIAQGRLDGIGTYTKNLLEHLQRLNVTVRPYSFPNRRKPTSAFENGQFFRFNYSISTLASLMNANPMGQGLQKKIDLLHVTDHMLPKLKKIPVVATICDAIMFDPKNWHWDTIRLANLKKWARKKTLHWADHYITISKAMVPELVEYIGLPEEKISVVYLGVDPIWSVPIPDEQKKQTLKKFNLPEKFFLATGTIQHKKNLPRLIQAYLQLPKDIQETYPLVIAGRKGWGTTESMQAIQQLTEQKKGRWLDYLGAEDLRALFQCASLYLHPSLHEGFGLTVLEAFASRTPVLTSQVTALPEIAGGAAYLVDPYSIEDIKQGIFQLITGASLQATLIKKGTARAREFTWEQCAAQTLKIYESVAL